MKDIQKQRVVIIGGGNGSAFSINAFKPWRKDFEISAVVSMSDSAGSTGLLRQEFNCLPPGDVMRAILAMSPYDYKILRKIFHSNRFTEGKLERHNLGNLFLVLASEYTKNYLQTIRAFEQAVEAVGHVYPNTLEKNDLVAGLSNCEIITCEAFIDRPRYPRGWRIKKAWLCPKVKAYDGAKEVINSADYIIFSPGSLYTSVIAAILPDGFKDAIADSKAKLIYVTGNAIHANGETGPETVGGLINTLTSYLPRKIDIALFNTHKLDDKQCDYYDEKQWKELAQDRENWGGLNVVEDDYERDGGGLCAEKLGRILAKILDI